MTLLECTTSKALSAYPLRSQALPARMEKGPSSELGVSRLTIVNFRSRSDQMAVADDVMPP